MKYIKDSLLILLYCFFTLFKASPDFYFVLAFLTALIICCADCFSNIDSAVTPVSLIYLAASWFSPAFLYFFPAVAYILFRRRAFVPLIAGAVLYVCYFLIQASDPFLFCVGVFGMLLALLLERQTTDYEGLYNLYKHTRDDSRELNLLLTEKNQTLMEKQDYEIYTATLKERNRIAREIHDNVGHLLSRSILMVGAMKTVNTSPGLSDPLDTLDSTLNSAMDSIRNSVHDLHDEAINLEEAIRTLINEFTFCPVFFQFDMSREIPKEIKFSFISITKEALSNIMRHSSATQVHLIMREHPALYQLSIEDNGTACPVSDSGIGLINMKERILALKGNIQIKNDRGFKIFITIPKEMT